MIKADEGGCSTEGAVLGTSKSKNFTYGFQNNSHKAHNHKPHMQSGALCYMGMQFQITLD